MLSSIVRCILILIFLDITLDKQVYYGANTVVSARMMNELALQSKSGGKGHFSLLYFYFLNLHWNPFWSATLNIEISASLMLRCPL